jgi:hypothetical protein
LSIGIFPNETYPYFNEGIPFNDNSFSALILWVLGLPLRHFCPTKYVDAWILTGRHSAVDTNSKERARVTKYDENTVKV